MARKPWMIPIQYVDDRFSDEKVVQAGGATGKTVDEDFYERDERDVEELLRRPDDREERDYECNDSTPVDYSRGPHDTEFGVDESAFDTTDAAPIDYDRGPSDEEYGVDDDDD